MTSAKKTNVNHAHIRDDRHLEERQVERARLHFDQRIGQENRGDDRRERDLKNQFEPAADAVRFLLRDLQVIVHKTERRRGKPC